MKIPSNKYIQINIKILTNLSDRMLLEINHRILPNDERANNLFKFVTLGSIISKNMIVIIIQK